jgi:hypothetical protein
MLSSPCEPPTAVSDSRADCRISRVQIHGLHGESAIKLRGPEIILRRVAEGSTDVKERARAIVPPIREAGEILHCKRRPEQGVTIDRQMKQGIGVNREWPEVVERGVFNFLIVSSYPFAILPGLNSEHVGQE